MEILEESLVVLDHEVHFILGEKGIQSNIPTMEISTYACSNCNLLSLKIMAFLPT